MKVGNRLTRAERGLSGDVAELREALEKVLARSGVADDPWVEERCRWLITALEFGLEGAELVAAYGSAFPNLVPAED